MRDLVQAAGDDPREVGEVGRHVEGEAVGGDPAREMDADRGDLLLPRPDADELLALPRLGGDAVVGQGADQHLLEVADVAPDVPPVGAEVDDRIADELPRAVVGDLAAAIALGDLDAARRAATPGSPARPRALALRPRV